MFSFCEEKVDTFECVAKSGALDILFTSYNCFFGPALY